MGFSNAPQAFCVRRKRREKVGNARACGSQRRAAGVPQAVTTVFYFYWETRMIGLPCAEEEEEKNIDMTYT